MTEGIQYLLPAGTRPAAALRLLAGRLGAVVDGSAATERTFYDTFDGRLHADGLVLLHDGGRLKLADAVGYGERAGAPCERPPTQLLVADLLEGPLRDALAPIVEMRALLPTTTVRSRARGMRVLDGEDKTVVRLALETAALAIDGRPRTRLRPRLRVAGVRGYDVPLQRVGHTLEQDLGLVVAGESAVRGGRDRRRRTARGRDVEARLRAVAGRARGCGGRHGARAPAGHDRAEPSRHARRRRHRVPARPARRRAPHAVGPAPARRRVPGRGARPLPRRVPVAAAGDRADARPRRAPARLRRTSPRCCRAQSPRTSSRCAACSPLTAATSAGGWCARCGRRVRSARSRAGRRSLPVSPTLRSASRPDAARPIAAVAGERIVRVYRRMVKMGRAIDDDSPPEALHDLRKKGKELRYLLELFGSVYPPEVAKPLVRALKELQDTLGRFQDREVQAALVRSLRDDVGGGRRRRSGADGDGAARRRARARSDGRARGVRRALRRVRGQGAAPARA